MISSTGVKEKYDAAWYHEGLSRQSGAGSAVGAGAGGAVGAGAGGAVASFVAAVGAGAGDAVASLPAVGAGT